MSERKNKPCPSKPEDLKGMPIGIEHCEFCGEMHGPSEEPPANELSSGMVSYPVSPVRMESIVLIGPPHTRPPLVPPSSFPTAGGDAAMSSSADELVTDEMYERVYGEKPDRDDN